MDSSEIGIPDPTIVEVVPILECLPLAELSITTDIHWKSSRSVTLWQRFQRSLLLFSFLQLLLQILEIRRTLRTFSQSKVNFPHNERSATAQATSGVALTKVPSSEATPNLMLVAPLVQSTRKSHSRMKLISLR